MERYYLQYPYWPGDAIGGADIYWSLDTTLPFVIDVDNLERAANWLPIYINCERSEGKKIKEMGAKWDNAREKWYIPAGVKRQPFIKWLALDPLFNNGTIVPNKIN